MLAEAAQHAHKALTAAQSETKAAAEVETLRREVEAGISRAELSETKVKMQ